MENTGDAAVCTPWEVKGETVDGKIQAIDYDKLIQEFGTRVIDQALLDRLERLTGRKPHIFLRRGLFFSHRCLDLIQVMLNSCEGADSHSGFV